MTRRLLSVGGAAGILGGAQWTATGYPGHGAVLAVAGVALLAVLAVRVDVLDVPSVEVPELSYLRGLSDPGPIARQAVAVATVGILVTSALPLGAFTPIGLVSAQTAPTSGTFEQFSTGTSSPGDWSAGTIRSRSPEGTGKSLSIPSSNVVNSLKSDTDVDAGDFRAKGLVYLDGSTCNGCSFGVGTESSGSLTLSFYTEFDSVRIREDDSPAKDISKSASGNTWWWVVLDGNSTHTRAKVWKHGTTRPSQWTVTADTSSSSLTMHPMLSNDASTGGVDLAKWGVASSGESVEITGPEYSVTGTVTSDDGEPIPNATVMADGNPKKVATTGSDGQYNLSLGPGNHTLRTAKVGYTMATKNITADGATTTDFSLVRQSNPATGTVYDGYRELVPGATITLTDDGEVVERTITDANGRYSLNSEVSDVTIRADRADLKGRERTGQSIVAGEEFDPFYLVEQYAWRDGYADDVQDPVVGADVGDLDAGNVTGDCVFTTDDVSRGIFQTVTYAMLSQVSGPTTAKTITKGATAQTTCQPNYEAKQRVHLLAAAATQNQSEQNAMAGMNNYLTDARAVAMSEAKVSVWNALANNATEAQALQEGREAADGFYYHLFGNTLTRYSTSVAQGEYIYKVEQNNSDTPGDPWIRPVYANGTETNFSSSDPFTTADVSLPGGRSYELITFRLANGNIVSPWPAQTATPSGVQAVDGPYLKVEGPDKTADGPGGAYTTIARSGEWHQQVMDIDDQREQIRANIDTLVTETYDQYQPSEVNATDFLDPSTIASRTATNYSSTGYYSFAAVQLATMGYEGSLNHSHTVETFRNRTISGTMFYTGNDLGQLTLDASYTPSNYGGTFLLATNNGIRTLNKPFTVVGQKNTRTGETVGQVGLESYTYATTDASNLRTQLDKMATMDNEYNDAQAAAGGGGTGDGSGGSSWMAVAIGAAVIAAIVVLND